MKEKNERDYIFTYKSKTPEGCTKRMVIMFFAKDSETPNIVSITKYVIVKKETVEASNGSFCVENGWFCIKKFSTFSFYRQSVIMTANDLFAINGMFVSTRHHVQLQQVEETIDVEFEMYLNIGFSNKGKIYRRIPFQGVSPGNCDKCCFSKDFCTGTYDAFEGNVNPVCKDSLNPSYYWIEAKSAADYNYVIEECIKLELFEKINSIAEKLNSIKNE